MQEHWMYEWLGECDNLDCMTVIDSFGNIISGVEITLHRKKQR
jgi:hypothetical protein